jgi:hypothetical protein
MSFFDEIFASQNDRVRMRVLASDAITRYGALAEEELLRSLRGESRWRERRVIRMAADEANWRNSKEWLPDFPPSGNAATAADAMFFPTRRAAEATDRVPGDTFASADTMVKH